MAHVLPPIDAELSGDVRLNFELPINFSAGGISADTASVKASALCVIRQSIFSRLFLWTQS